MAIRLWQPKWYKYWCQGLRIGFNTRYKYEDKKLNSIKRTHKGYIIPNDANLEVEPSFAWHITYIISVLLRFSLLIFVLYIAFMESIILFLWVLFLMFVIRFMPAACNGNSLYDIIFWNWR
jgi:hypothetical protein